MSASVASSGARFGPIAATRTQFKSAGDFLRAAAINPHQVMAAAAGQSEGIGEEGGFAVPPQFSAALLNRAAEISLFLSRANVIPATSNMLVLPTWDLDQTGGKRGGLTAVWLDEAQAATYAAGADDSSDDPAEQSRHLARAHVRDERRRPGYARRRSKRSRPLRSPLRSTAPALPAVVRVRRSGF